ncbi:MAG TPA: rhodanese-like domain-containing protein [Kofleriaceae bacterium]|jgi:phage shock protein E
MRTALFALALLGACSKSEPAKTEDKPVAHAPGEIHKDPAKAKDLMAKGAVVVDVREPDEFDGEHLPQATNIPLGEVDARLADFDKLVGGDKSKPIVLHCAKGGRAEKAKAKLEAAGYTNVVNGGGLKDLQ